MSKTVKAKIEFHDRDLLQERLRALGHRFETSEQVRGWHVYNRDECGTLAFWLPGWNYPVVVDDGGVARYDNYKGAWGKQSVYDAFTQDYVAHVTAAEAAAMGWRIEGEAEQLADGSLLLTVVE